MNSITNSRLDEVAANSHLQVKKISKEESIISPLNLSTLKSVSTSTPQDFVQFFNTTANLNGNTDETKHEFSSYLNRNQSYVKIIRNDDKVETPSSTCKNSKMLKRSESLTSETLLELNNCIAQFDEEKSMV